MIIDVTDFNDRPYKVPNQEESRDFEAFILSKEEELGRMILGNELYEEFATALEGSAPIDTIWDDLKDGASYEYNSKPYQYKGWVDLIRPGIFAEWLPDNNLKLTNIGYVENSASQQSKLLDNQYEFQVKHWNKFVSKVGFQHGYGYSCKDTFYGFMRANLSDYPSWVFKCPKYKNRFDL